MPLFFLFFTVFMNFFTLSLRAGEPADLYSVAKLTQKRPLLVNNYPHVLCEDEIKTTHKLITYVYGYEENDSEKIRYFFALQADTGKLIWKMAYRETPHNLIFSGHDLIIEYDWSLMCLNSLSCEIKSIEYFSNPQQNILTPNPFKKKNRRLSVF